MARGIALMALVVLGLSGLPFHDPFHASSALQLLLSGTANTCKAS
jgi:hypothetical protein